MNKRFTIVDEQFISYYGGTGHKISNGECGFWLWHSKEESQKVCDKLNNILDENEQLKETINNFTKGENYLKRKEKVIELQKENEQLKQQLSYIEYRFTEYRIKRGDLE